MGIFQSLSRFFSSLLGLLQGKTERLTDKMVSANADTIRAQFRKTKEDWNRDYQEMRNSIAELMNIRETKLNELKSIGNETNELEHKMQGAVELFKQNSDERYKKAYTQMAEKLENNESRSKELELQISEQDKAIELYKARLQDLQKQIETLNKEEAETVADMIGSQKIKELNDRLSGLSIDSSTKNLEAIRQARQKLKSVAKISTEMGPNSQVDLDKELTAAAARSKHINAFENAVFGENKSSQSSSTSIQFDELTSGSSSQKIYDVHTISHDNSK